MPLKTGVCTSGTCTNEMRTSARYGFVDRSALAINAGGKILPCCTRRAFKHEMVVCMFNPSGQKVMAGEKSLQL